MSYEIEQQLTPGEVRRLLDDLCVVLGFCLPPADYERFMRNPPLDSRDFADDVFRAEGMEPKTSDIRLWREVRDKIHAHFDRATTERST